MLRKLFIVLTLIGIIGTSFFLPAQASNETQRVQTRAVELTPKQAKQAIHDYLKYTRLPLYAVLRKFQNIKSFEVVDVKELPLDFVRTTKKTSYYQSNGVPFKFVYAAIRFEVKKENKYFLNGINYRVATLVHKRGKWVVDYDTSDPYRYAAYEFAPVHTIVEQKLGFGTADEKGMAEIIRKHYQGIYVNRKGENVADRGSDNFATEEDIRKEMTGATGSLPTELIPTDVNPNYKRPKYIRVAMKSHENRKYYGCAGVTECIRRVDFLEYLKHVLPIEWSPEDPEDALKAGAIAIKQYTWYKIAVDPAAGTGDADVFDTTRDQIYLADLSERFPSPEEKKKLEKVQSIFHEPGVAGIGFKEAKRDNLFFFEYKKHTGSKASGTVSQLGTVKLANSPHNKKYLDIIKYYLEGSPQANKSKINFFRYAK